MKNSTHSPIGHGHEDLEAPRGSRKPRPWEKKERAVHELEHSEKPATTIAHEAGVSRQTLYHWRDQHDAALDLVWGRPGGLRQVDALEDALAKTQEHERTAREALALERRRALLHEIASECLRATKGVVPEQAERAALLAAVERARSAEIPLREIALAIGISEPTLRRRLAPPSSEPPPERRPHPRSNKVRDPKIREAVHQLRLANPEWGPKRIAKELRERTENPIFVGHNVVAKILKELGLSRPYEREKRSDRRIEITCPLPITGSDLKQVPLADGTTVFLMPVVLLLFRVVLGFVIFRQFPTSAEVRDAFAAIVDGSLGTLPFAHKTDNGPETKGSFKAFLKAKGTWRWAGIPHWPRSNGIVERLLETFDLEVLKGKVYASVEELQAAALAWLDRYNLSRPHETLGGIAPLWKLLGWLADPLERIRHLEVLRDGLLELVVGKDGRVAWNGRSLFVGRDFKGKTVGLLEYEGWISVWVDGIPLFRITAPAPEEAAAA